MKSTRDFSWKKRSGVERVIFEITLEKMIFHGTLNRSVNASNEESMSRQYLSPRVHFHTVSRVRGSNWINHWRFDNRLHGLDNEPMEYKPFTHRFKRLGWILARTPCARWKNFMNRVGIKSKIATASNRTGEKEAFGCTCLLINYATSLSKL